MVLDIAYGALIFEGRTPNLTAVARRVSVATRNSMGRVLNCIALMRTQSKEAAHPGGRLGAILIKNRRICQIMKGHLFLKADGAARLTQIKTYETANSQRLDQHLKAHTRYLKQNIETLIRVFEQKGIGYVRPDGGFYVIFDNLGEDVDPWAFGITYVDGEPFRAPKMTRFSYAGPRADIEEAASRISRFYNSERKCYASSAGADTAEAIKKEFVLPWIYSGPYSLEQERHKDYLGLPEWLAQNPQELTKARSGEMITYPLPRTWDSWGYVLRMHLKEMGYSDYKDQDFKIHHSTPSLTIRLMPVAGASATRLKPMGAKQIDDIMSLPNPAFYKDEAGAKIMVWLATQA
jgi:hypothetical protein